MDKKCVCRKKEREGDVYFKKLTHMDMEAGQLKICKMGELARDLEKNQCGRSSP